MLIEIILKEIREHLYSLRFLLTTLLCVSMMIVSGFVFVGKYNQNLDDFKENLNNNNSNLSSASNKLCDAAFLEQQLQIKPSVTELIAEGGLKHLPNASRMNTFIIQLPETIKRTNILLPDFTDVDWTFIISLILSFFALLLVYDAVCGEKRAGTLRLLQSNSISRTSVIMSKYLGAMAILSIPLLISVLLSLVIVILLGQITFDSVQIAQVFIFLLAVLFYLSIFVLIGLFISSKTSNPVTSIIYSLLIWVVVVILIPHSGGIIAAKVFPIPTWQEVDREIRHRRSEIGDAHRARYSQVFRWNGNPWAEWVPYRSRAVNEMAEARNSMMSEHIHKMIGQIEKARLVTQISPTAVFANLSEKISNTGITHFKKFYQQVYNYRQNLTQYIIVKDKDDPDSPHLLNEWHKVTISQKPVDASSIPRFEEKMMTSKLFQNVLFDFVLLILFNLVLFSLAYVAFLRYDVR